MNDSTGKFLGAALAFEAGLGAVALAAGWLLGFNPCGSVQPSTTLNLWALGWGLLATGPLVAGLLGLDRYPGPLRPFKQFVETQLVPLFARLSVAELALLSLVAGVGEELLFRGLIQAGLAAWLGPPYGVAIALIAASLLFGVCHWLNATYAALATLIGLYFGWLLLAADNLLAPMLAHGLYDFVALMYMTRWGNRKAGTPAQDATTLPKA